MMGGGYDGVVPSTTYYTDNAMIQNWAVAAVSFCSETA
jgi:hypothetical protein